MYGLPTFPKPLLYLGLTGLLSLAACDAGRQGDPAALLIYGGTPVPENAYPAVVGLAYRQSDGTFRIDCTGTLIAPDAVLTAGHCLNGPGLDLTATDSDLSSLRVYTGLGAEGGRVAAVPYAVVRVVAHPSLRAHPLGYADIGVVRLEDPVLDIEPVVLVKTLAEQLALNAQGTTTLVGYGKREDNGRGVKYEVTTTLTAATSHEATAGGGGRDACAGDSGGPAFAILPRHAADKTAAVRQVGIVSRGRGIGCGQGGYVSLVSDHVCWVEGVLGEPLAGADAHCDWTPTPGGDDASFADLCAGRAGGPAAREAGRHIRLALDAASCADAAATLASRTKLALDHLMLRDLSPLSRLRQLESLSLVGNRVTDLTPLRALPRLKDLRIAGNDVRDLEALAPLEAAGLVVAGKRRQVYNFAATPFAAACGDPAASDAARHTVKAVLAKTLSEDCPTANQRLLGQTELALVSRDLTDLGPLATLTHVVALDLTGNARLTDVAPLADWESLRSLSLTDTQVTDLSALAPLVARGLVVTGAP